MKVIIAGSRDCRICTDTLSKIVKASGFDISEVVSGTARGADRLGEQWADLHNIPVKQFPAEWNTYGRSAGYKRNGQMAEYADALIALWDGKSRGTKHMIDLAEKQGLKVYTHRY